jgi:hypothetical protein
MFYPVRSKRVYQIQISANVPFCWVPPTHLILRLGYPPTQLQVNPEVPDTDTADGNQIGEIAVHAEVIK